MYIVKINYGGDKKEYAYRGEKQATRHWAGWYNHGLDMCGQVESTCEIWNTKTNECILSDRW